MLAEFAGEVFGSWAVLGTSVGRLWLADEGFRLLCLPTHHRCPV